MFVKYYMFPILYRRTRRPTSLKPSDNAAIFTNPNSTDGSVLKIEENSKTPITNLEDQTGKEPCLMKDSEDKNGIHSGENFYSESAGFSNHLEVIEKKHHEEAPINSNNFISKELGNTNFKTLKRGLKRPIYDPVPPAGIRNRPTACANFRNESEDGKMPVILDVFTLSEVPTSYVKTKTTNIMRENNFPVTPPCSPPLLNLEQFTRTQNNNFREGNTTRYFSGNGVAMRPLNQPATISNLPNIYRSSVRHDRPNETNGSAIAMNQYMYKTNCAVDDQTRRCYNVNNGDSIQFLQATVKDKAFPHSRKFAPPGFIPEEGNLLSESGSKKEQDILKAAKTSDLCVYSELLQDPRTTRNYFSMCSMYETSKFAKREHSDTEQSKAVKCLPTPKNNADFCDKMGQTLEERKTGSVHNTNVLPEVTLTGKTSYTMTQATIDECNNGVNKSHVFLSPRDVKVLQLKKRLQEQEAVLDKLRKNQ